MKMVRRFLPAADSVPARSTLYPLAPRNMDGTEGECFSSYLQRLAWAYRISTRQLIVDLFLPLQGTPVTQALTRADKNTINAKSRSLMSLNASSPITQQWLAHLQQVTLRSDLHTLTTERWQYVSQYLLLRQRPAWCSVCYQQWQSQGELLYQPLIWQYRAITTCLRHGCRLVTRCPACERTQLGMVGKVQEMGRCTWCRAWLMETPATAPRKDVAALQATQWAYRIISEVREMEQEGTSATWEAMLATIVRSLQAHGKVTMCAAKLDLHPSTIVHWTATRNLRPTIERLVMMCTLLGRGPRELAREGSVVPLPISPMYQEKPRVNRRRFDYERVNGVIQAAFESGGGIRSYAEFARWLQVPVARLAAWYPELLKEMKRRAQVGAAKDIWPARRYWSSH